jgi:hypothetical protein
VSKEHKALLRDFLADCDRVKFAGYEPGAEESRGVLEAARTFLLETRESALASQDANVEQEEAA